MGTEVSPTGRDAPHHADLLFFNLTNWQDEHRLSVLLHLIKNQVGALQSQGHGGKNKEEAVDLRTIQRTTDSRTATVTLQ